LIYSLSEIIQVILRSPTNDASAYPWDGWLRYTNC